MVPLPIDGSLPEIIEQLRRSRSLVLLAEFHERSLHTDVAVALLREVQQTVRPDLMLVIMSATLEAEPAAAYLGGCPIVRAEGRTYPIDIRYEPATQAPLPERVANTV